MIIYQHIDNSKINVRANQKLDNPEKLDACVRACVCVCVRVCVCVCVCVCALKVSI